MSNHRQRAKQIGVQVFFCDPHSLWPSDTNENTNGLSRQYLSKRIDPSQLTQVELDAIALQMNNPPCKVLEFRRSLEARADIMSNLEKTNQRRCIKCVAPGS